MTDGPGMQDFEPPGGDRSPEGAVERRTEITRHAITFTLLAILTGSFWLVALIYPEVSLVRLTLSLFSILIIFSVYSVIRIIAVRQIRGRETRYSFRRAASILYFVTVIIVLLRIWVDTNYIFVAYGIIGAGIAIALQDLFKNFVGGILIIFARTYQVGDRIEISETMGDVIDIGILTTRILEIHARDVKGDQATGRIAVVPNGDVISSRVFNYTMDHSFVWDEISIPVTYGSDWQRAVSLFLDIVRRETAVTAGQAEREIEKIGERYYLPKRDVEPSVYLTLTDNWIAFDIRYVTEVRKKRVTKDDLSRKLLDAVEATDGITIATENIIVYDGGPTGEAA